MYLSKTIDANVVRVEKSGFAANMNLMDWWVCKMKMCALCRSVSNINTDGNMIVAVEEIGYGKCDECGKRCWVWSVEEVNTLSHEPQMA